MKIEGDAAHSICETHQLQDIDRNDGNVKKSWALERNGEKKSR